MSGPEDYRTATGEWASEAAARWVRRETDDSPYGAAPDTGQAREPVTLVDLRARIAAAFAAVDNFAGEPPTRDQLDWAHIAACVALNIGQDQPTGDTRPPRERLRVAGRNLLDALEEAEVDESFNPPTVANLRHYMTALEALVKEDR